MLNQKLDFANYRAKVVKIQKLDLHPNADKLQIAIVDFQRVITSLHTKEGDLFVYFPLESQLDKEFISFINGFENKELNQNPEIRGFFNKQARCRAIRLRGELSEGYLHPVSSVNSFLEYKKINYAISESDIGIEFDSIGDVIFCKKYFVEPQNKGGSLSTVKKAKDCKKIVDGQFRLHADTQQLKRNLFKIEKDSIISCTSKIHGCNACFSKLLCRKPLKWYEKILKKIGVNIVDYHYDYVVASRKVIKDEKQPNGFYDFNIWTHAFSEIKESIREGITLYGEICGYLPNHREIQKGYDYGCEKGKHKLYIFRITYTNHNGDVFEFTWPQIKRYCERYNLQTVPFIFYGKAKDFYPEILKQENWSKAFLSRLTKDYLEKDCKICNNKVPAEGIVLVLEDEVWTGLKLKSEAFYLRESKELDSGEENVEDL